MQLTGIDSGNLGLSHAKSFYRPATKEQSPAKGMRGSGAVVLLCSDCQRRPLDRSHSSVCGPLPLPTNEAKLKVSTPHGSRHLEVGEVFDLVFVVSRLVVGQED